MLKTSASRFFTGRRFSIQASAQFEKIQKRLEIIYEDKIDEKISGPFYEKKFAEYTNEKEQVLEKLNGLNKSNTQYYETGYAIHELATNARAIYSNPNATAEDKRLLLSYSFSNIKQNRDKITPNYTLAFEFLAEWMPKVNEIFERKKDIPDNEISYSASENVLLGRQMNAIRTCMVINI